MLFDVKSLLAAVLVAMLGCGHATHAPAHFPDAPLELGDDTDRDQAIDQLWVLAPGADRERLRATIADALVRRIAVAAAEDQPLVVGNLVELVDHDQRRRAVPGGR